MKIRLFAHLKDKFGSSELEVLLESNMKVKDLREALLKNYSINTSNSMCAVNMVYVEDSYSIDKNDEIAFIPPVSGGSSEDFVEITKNEILIIIDGLIIVNFYSKKKLFKKLKLYSGDIIIFFGGTHGFEIEKKSRFIEVKQGPYYQQDIDKETFTLLPKKKVKKR